MIYPSNFENKIGFNVVRKSIGDLCVSENALRFCEEMQYSTDSTLIRFNLECVAEMCAIIDSGTDIPLHNVRNITALLNTLTVGGMFLTAEELSTLRKSLQAMTDITVFFDQYNGDENAKCPQLNSVVAGISSFKNCVAAINNIVDPLGQVKDSASTELADLRRRLSSASSTIAATMRRVISNAVGQGILEGDVTPTMRDGRLVIPVPPMHKRRINGIVHDESASGKTVFIEPAEVVEVNNRVRELEMDVQREIRRILVVLASELRPYVDQIRESDMVVGEIDFIHAKAQYSYNANCHLPTIEDQPALEIYGARHPVLEESLRKSGREIVPLNVVLSHDKRLLVISGPNAGGKSVCLKTVGISQYMLQCGVLPCVYENSVMGIFESIFMDIGDNQSIEDDLSTYSSHLTNMKNVLKYGNDKSLLLIDEFGGGTEPQIGGAIAQALLDKFNKMKMWGVVTTHYQNLKHFAEDTPGLVNGSMLYDRGRMIPLFQLMIGTPGSSFALEIARKIGLPGDILSEATEIVGAGYVDMDKYLLDIARDKKYWENKRLSIKQKEKKIDQAIADINSKADDLRMKRREIIDDAKSQAQKILEGSNAIIERTIHDIRKSQARREETLEARKKMKEERESLLKKNEQDHDLLKRLPKQKNNKKGGEKIAKRSESIQLSVGSVVKLDGAGQPGEIAEINGKKAVVVFGQLKTTVELRRLQPTNAKIQSKSNSSSLYTQTLDDSRKRQLEFNRQIDVRGMRADEAVQAVMYFIDDAVQFGADQVRILHGTGTGALRQSIREYLSGVAAVRNYHDEHVQFGGAGITVVEF